MGSVVSGQIVRPLVPRDHAVVLDLVNADRLPGQPVVTEAMLGEALAGRSTIDAAWWRELDLPVTEVATGQDGGVAGVISYATRPRDGRGQVLWLHAAEDRSVIGTLLARALQTLGDCPVIEAFSFAADLTIGVEALPVRHLPATASALLELGFTAEDLWRYMHRNLPAADLPRASNVEVSTPEPGTRQLTVNDGGKIVAEATVGVPIAGIGVLWWISTVPEARGAGYGRALLGSALALLTELGAREVILYVDDDEPGGERDRSAANTLYDSCGFIEVDRLHSYRRTQQSSPVRP